MPDTHRTPTSFRRRTARRLATATAAIATAVAAPALLATPAEAASDRTWNRLAMCESGRNWSINTGNGYYGGLQFSQRTWAGFGGRHWAVRAHRATRAEQVHIAEKVLDVQGWGAWPSCSSRLGLGGKHAKGNPKSDPRFDRDGRDGRRR